MFVCTSSRLLVELRRFANSVKLSRLTLVLLLRFTAKSPAVRLPLLVLAVSSSDMGTLFADTERYGSPMELEQLLRCEGPVPLRGRRPPPLEEWLWSADIAWGFKKGIGGLMLAGGERGDSCRDVGAGVRRPAT